MADSVWLMATAMCYLLSAIGYLPSAICYSRYNGRRSILGDLFGEHA